ncbi:MAG: biopolymer transporter ExbD [Planctomyces sp.]|nr:biopolymer transporter ExbD [Planctomyces sp.]
MARKRFAIEDDMDITPMIDMTFLLLIFFMVSSTMDAASVLKLPPAKHGKGVITDTSTIVTVLMDDGEAGVYLSDGKKANGPVTLPEVTAYVEQGKRESQKTTVIIKADREAPSGFVEEVARAANEVEGIEQFFVGVQDVPQN